MVKSKFVILLANLLSFYVVCFPAKAISHLYVGGQLGDGKADYGDIFSSTASLLPNHNSYENGLAGRFYLGYQLTPYIGGETGYSIFSDTSYKATNLTNGNFSTLTIKTEMWDILGVVGMPIRQSGFRGDIKAGAAYVMSQGNLSSNLLGNNSAHDNNWNPASGISISYSINHNFLADVTYLHIFGAPDVTKNLNANIDFIALGVKYLFG